MKTSDSIQNFRAYATTWQGATIAVVCAGAAAFLRMSHQTRPKDAGEVDTLLRAAVAETGRKTAQLYRYLGLARALAARVDKLEDGPLQDVLDAENADQATQELVTFLDKQDVQSVDAISVLLDTYKRAPKKRPATKTSRAASAPARVTAATIRGVVEKVPEDKLVSTFIKTHKPEHVLTLAGELAKQIDDRDMLAEVIQVFEDRMEELVRESGRRRPRRTVEHDRHLQ